MSNCVKSKSRESFVRLKSESPKFKDVLRKKCQQRWRENRWKFLDVNRSIPENEEIQNTLTNIIKEDLKSMRSSSSGDLAQNSTELDRNLQELDEIKNELLDDELKWLMNEYDKILDNEDRLADLLNELDHVICPLCQKNTLVIECSQFASFAVCTCGVKIPTNLQLPQIKDNITKCIGIHDCNCDHNPQFEIINEDGENHLYLLCYVCSNFSMLL
ncbi:RPA-interacting protein alpha [Arctopsyche grandis]|uniref:RPA-interacting protein alpha n=1 Tax=Arctopsyche grandis TaxID=121162 RepID=UPI00406D8ABE